MNHVSLPTNAQNLLEVPYLCDNEIEYDGLGFSEYPERMGWSSSDKKFGWVDCSPLIAAARAQNWLFFGLLRLFLGSRYQQSDYLKRSSTSNGLIIHFVNLAPRLKQLVKLYRKKTLRQHVERNQDTWDAAWFEAGRQSDLLEQANNIREQECLLIGLSIKLLLWSIRRALIKIFTFRDEGKPLVCSAPIVPATLPFVQMLRAGWCVFQASNFRNLYTASLNNYLAALPRPILSDNSDHRNCTLQDCVRNNVNEAVYQTQHTRPECGCHFIGPEISKIIQIIRSNGIPLIALSLHDFAVPRLEVRKAEVGTKYVTISHVWSGGLGNFNSNKLPACQLTKLYLLLKELDKFQPEEPGPRYYRSRWLSRVFNPPLDGFLSADLIQRYVPSGRSKSRQPQTFLFWMDTLCIPVSSVGDTSVQSLKQKAITNMSLIYAAATRCLVLDPELQRIAMHGLSLTQLNVHVLCSAWLTRSWTFQEARLSRNWYARFSDGFYNPKCLENAWRNNMSYGDWNDEEDDEHELAVESIQWYYDMPALRQFDLTMNENSREINGDMHTFRTMWNHLVSRSTSKPEDVLGILANITGLNVGEVLELERDKRMKAILKAQKNLPTGLFFNLGPKIEDAYNRWVPSYPRCTHFSELYGDMQLCSEGYSFPNENVGFLVSLSELRRNRIKLFDPARSVSLWLTFNEETDSVPVSFNAPGDLIAMCYVFGGLEESSVYRSLIHRSAGARFGVRRQEGNVVHLVYEHSFLYSHDKIRTPLYQDYHEIVGQRMAEDTVLKIDCGELRWISSQILIDLLVTVERYADRSSSNCTDLSSWPTLDYKPNIKDEHKSKGLEIRTIFWTILMFSVWISFYLASVFTQQSPQKAIQPSIILLSRVFIGILELQYANNQYNEWAYKNWVRLFDEMGSFDSRNERQDQADWMHGIDLRRWGIGLGICSFVALLVIVVPGEKFLLILALALLTELILRQLCEFIWLRTWIGEVIEKWLEGRH